MRLDPARLTAIVGSDAIARKLMVEAAGHRIPALTADRVSRETLYANIRADLASGYTYAEAAKMHNVSRYTVWRAVTWAHRRRNVT